MVASGARRLLATCCSLILGALLLSGCSALTSADAPSAEENPQKLYAEAKAELDSGSWDRAIKGMERVEARAPGTLLAQQAILDTAYAQWRSGERAAATATLDRFAKQHPSSPACDYALYLRGLVNFNDRLGFLSAQAGQRITERDQRGSRDAYQAFSQLVQQFPRSRYAEDASARMDYIVNALAEYEIHVARYYFRRGAYVAAANRARMAVTEFERAPAAEEGLAIMALSYDRLGLTDLRDASMKVLRLNFPETRFVDGDTLRNPRSGRWWHLD